MKNIKNYDDFLNEREGNYPENSPEGEKLKKMFGQFTAPEKPFKRKLTKEEQGKLFHHFPLHSFSDVDATGKIVLGGGESERGKFYLNEEDLEKLS